MKLAEFKRRLQPGVKVTLIWAKNAANWGGAGIINPEGSLPEQRRALLSGQGITREVTRVQSNAVAFRQKPDSSSESWLYFPKAADFKSNSDHEFSILEDGQVLLTYVFEP